MALLSKRLDQRVAFFPSKTPALAKIAGAIQIAPQIFPWSIASLAKL
jgi:hypothetical protein